MVLNLYCFLFAIPELNCYCNFLSIDCLKDYMKMLELVLEGEKHVKEAKNNLVRYLYTGNKEYVIHFTFDKEIP